MINSSAGLSKADKASLYFVAWMWSFNIWHHLLSVIRRTPVLQLFTNYTIPTISILLGVYAIALNKDRIKRKDVIFCLVIIFVYIVHIVAFPNNAEKLIELQPFFFFSCFPYFIVGLFVDFNKQKNVLEYVSMAVILLNMVYRYIFNIGEGEGLVVDLGGGDDMGTAYFYLPHCLLLLYSILQRFNIWKFLCVMVSLIMILGSGNRGSLLMIVLFLVLFFVLVKTYKKPILSRAVIIIIGLIAFLFLQDFAFFMSDWIVDLDLGFNDRTFRFFLEGNIADDNGRDAIKTMLINSMSQSPLWGYGLCGDRVLTGTYSHDLFWELCVSFGYLFGIVLFIWFVSIVIKGYLNCSTVNNKGFMIILFLLGFAVLFISDSFLQNRFFWLLLGYAINLRRNTNEILNSYEKTTVSMRTGKPNGLASSMQPS